MIARLQRVLVLDDDRDVLEQGKRVLGALGAGEVVCCATVEEAEESVEAQPKFDLVLVDLRIPKISGNTFLQYLRNHGNPVVRSLTVLVLLGVTQEAEIHLLSELSYTNVIKKPFKDTELEKKIREVILEEDSAGSEKRYQTALEDCLEARDFSQATALIRERLEKSPSSPKYLTHYARVLFCSGHLQKADATLTKVLSKSPEFIPALNLLAKVKIKAGEHATALTLMEKAQRVSPLNIQRIIAMAEMHMSSGRPALAEHKYRKALELYPHAEGAKVGLARSLIEQGKDQEGKEILAAMEDPDEVAGSFNMRAIMLVKAGMYEEAIELYENVLKVMVDKRKNHLILYNMALAHLKRKDFESAMRIAKKCQEASPKEYVKGQRLPKRVEQALHDSAEAAEGELESQASQESKESHRAAPSAEFLVTQDQLDFLLGEGHSHDLHKGEEMDVALGEEKKVSGDSLSYPVASPAHKGEIDIGLGRVQGNAPEPATLKFRPKGKGEEIEAEYWRPKGRRRSFNSWRAV